MFVLSVELQRSLSPVGVVPFTFRIFVEHLRIVLVCFILLVSLYANHGQES